MWNEWYLCFVKGGNGDSASVQHCDEAPPPPNAFLQQLPLLVLQSGINPPTLPESDCWAHCDQLLLFPESHQWSRIVPSEDLFHSNEGESVSVLPGGQTWGDLKSCSPLFYPEPNTDQGLWSNAVKLIDVQSLHEFYEGVTSLNIEVLFESRNPGKSFWHIHLVKLRPEALPNA